MHRSRALAGCRCSRLDDSTDSEVRIGLSTGYVLSNSVQPDCDPVGPHSSLGKTQPAPGVILPAAPIPLLAGLTYLVIKRVSKDQSGQPSRLEKRNRRTKLSPRPAVPRIVERKLWSESMGHCMNPDCHTHLFEEGASIGEMAHIEPHAVGGDTSFDNLVMLCRNCHGQIDSARTASTEATLSIWKMCRNREIRQRFTRTYRCFEELSSDVVPILKRNLTIFESYGPSSDRSDDDGRHALWLRFEGELISNNRKLAKMLEQNQSLLHRENQQIVQEFTAHTQEFIHTRETPNSRVNLFPCELNSFF